MQKQFVYFLASQFLVGLIILYTGAIWADLPVRLTIVNNTSIDVRIKASQVRHIAAADTKTLETQKVFAGATETFILNRTYNPADILLRFYADGSEGGMAGYLMGQWEYVEIPYVAPDFTPNQPNYTIKTCHNVFSRAPFTVECSQMSPLGARVEISNVSQ